MTDEGLTGAQQQLCQFMSDTSERAYFARWMAGTEYRLWAFMTDENDDGEWGNLGLTTDERSELLRLSEQIGGWIYWPEAIDGGIGTGPKFIATADWQKIYNRRARESAIFRRYFPPRYVDFLKALPDLKAYEAEIRAMDEQDGEG